MLGRFIVDFYAPCHRLVVEVDGGVHGSLEARARDAARQAELESLFGVHFVRAPGSSIAT